MAFFCSQCKQHVDDLICPRCNTFNGGVKRPAPKILRMELSNAALVWRQVRKLTNYVPTIHGKSGWVLEEENGVATTSFRNLSEAKRFFGKVISLELVDGGVLILFNKRGGLLCTGFSWGQPGEGADALASVILNETNLVKTLAEARALVVSWPKDMRSVVWGDRDAPSCPVCRGMADDSGGCESCCLNF